MSGNTKISALSAGAPAQAGDLIPIDRSGSNFSLQVSDIGAEILTSPNVSKAITTGINAIGNASGATAVDLSKGNVVTMTLTGNVTLSLSNAVAAAGEDIMFIITQNGTGGFTVTWPTTLPAGIAPAVSVAPNAVSVFRATVDGSGNLCFVGNGPITISRITTAGITGSQTSGAVFTPSVNGRYRISAIMYCTTTGTGGGTMKVVALTSNGNVQGAIGNSGMSNTATTRSTGSVSYATVTDGGSSNDAFGFETFLTSTNTGGVFSVDLIVEYLGN